MWESLEIGAWMRSPNRLETLPRGGEGTDPEAAASGSHVNQGTLLNLFSA